MKFRIVRVRPAPEGFGDKTIGLVDFDFEPDAFNRNLKITRYVAPPEGSPAGTKGTTYDRAVIACGAGAVVRVKDAQLCKGEKGHYLTVQDIEIEYDLRRDIANDALQMLKINAEEVANKRRYGAQADDADPFAGPAGAPARVPVGAADDAAPPF